MEPYRLLPARPNWYVNDVSLQLVTYSFSDTLPEATFIFSFPSPSEEFSPRLRSVIVNSGHITQARWNPQRKGSLGICTGEKSIYTWSDEWAGELGDEELAECIGVPASKLTLLSITEWSQD
jgi:hypothetical protein